MSHQEDKFQRYATEYDPVKIGSIDDPGMSLNYILKRGMGTVNVISLCVVGHSTADVIPDLEQSPNGEVPYRKQQSNNTRPFSWYCVPVGTDTTPHDRAILRALHSEYAPNKSVRGDPRHTVFVARLHPRTTQDTLLSEFSDCGKILRCRLVKDIVTGKSKQYALIEFERSSDVDTALQKHKEYIDNTEVIVEREVGRVMKGWKPRRLGGGFGGNKNSGQLRFGCRDRPFKRPIKVGEERRD